MAGFLQLSVQMPSCQPLNLLHVAAPGTEGGLESVVLELVGGLQQLGHRVTLAAVQDAGAGDSPLLRRVADRGVEVRRIAVPARAYGQEFRQVREAIEAAAPDVVHTHGYRGDLLGGLAARRAGVPWVTTAHGFTGGDAKNRFYEWLQRRAFRKAGAVIAVSATIRNRLFRAGVASGRLHLVPNAWTPKPVLTREEARRRLGIAEDSCVIGWVGRLTSEKGPDLYLSALSRLPGRQWYASVIGDGRERGNLERQARQLGIADRVRWHGLVPDAATLYPAFDVWVLSSRTEGTPIALFEAMAARVPVVAAAVGGVPDVVSSSEARLVPPGRPEALAAAIAEVLADVAGGAARAEVARDRLVEAFATPAWLAAHVAVYQTVAHHRVQGI